MRGRRLLYDCLKLSFFMLCANVLCAQQSIKIVDEEGQAMIGVTVYLDGVPNYSTDTEGKVEVELSEFKTLSISYLGYENTYFTKSQMAKLKYVLPLTLEDSKLEEILIVGRTNANSRDLPFNVEAIDSKDIKITQSQTSADAIASSGSVYVQKSQMGGGSPVVRGFEANKILLVVDGVRMNNAIYRGGHLQNAITLDASILNRAELIFGPGSLLYGSDAIGGVIHFRTKNPLVDGNKFSGGAYARYASANDENTIHGNFILSNQKKLASLTSFTYSKFGELRAGANRSDDYPDWGKRFEYVVRENGEDVIKQNEDPNVQVGTAYNQMDILQKVVYEQSEDLRIALNMQYSVSSNIPRYDFLSEYSNGTLRYATWNYGPQLRFLVSPVIEYDGNNKFFDKLMINSSYQRVQESRLVRNLNDPIETSQIEDLNIYGVNVDFRKTFPNNSLIEYGASAYSNQLESTASGIDVNTNETQTNLLTRYPSNGSEMLQAGVYAHHRMDLIKDELFWNVGTRWSVQSTSFLFKRDDPITWPEYYYNGIENTNNSLVWMTGFNYQKKNWQIKLLGGSAFRAPNVDDLAKVRIKTDEITVPNPELKPESTNNVELNLAYRGDKLKAGGTVFYSLIDNIVVRRGFNLPDGSQTYESAGDTLNVTANVNANKGKVRGLSGHIEYELTSEFSFAANINYTIGTSIDDLENESPLDHIPPLYGRVQIKHQLKNWENRLVMRYNGVKKIEDYGGSADNPEYALPEGIPAWQTYNFYSSYSINKSWNIQASVENILDTHYRLFASGLSAPGRNFILSLNYKW